MRLVFLCALNVVVGACSSEGPVDGNANPKTATCDTHRVMTCSSGSSCHAFFSNAAADASRSDCIDLGYPISTDCASTYTACCLELDGSNGYPEEVCLPASEADSVKSKCTGSRNIYCGP